MIMLRAFLRSCTLLAKFRARIMGKMYLQKLAWAEEQPWKKERAYWLNELWILRFYDMYGLKSYDMYDSTFEAQSCFSLDCFFLPCFAPIHTYSPYLVPKPSFLPIKEQYTKITLKYRKSCKKTSKLHAKYM